MTLASQHNLIFMNALMADMNPNPNPNHNPNPDPNLTLTLTRRSWPTSALASCATSYDRKTTPYQGSKHRAHYEQIIRRQVASSIVRRDRPASAPCVSCMWHAPFGCACAAHTSDTTTVLFSVLC